MLRSPKERFLASTNSGPWGKLTSGELFEDAVHSAMSQLATELPMECPVPQIACDAHQQMIGARKYMEILSSLHVPVGTTKTTPRKELNPEAGI